MREPVGKNCGVGTKIFLLKSEGKYGKIVYKVQCLNVLV